MILMTLVPQFGRPEQALSVAGEAISFGDAVHDFSHVAEGENYAPPLTDNENLFITPVQRIDGVLHVTMIYHLSETASQDQPDAPWVIEVDDGPVLVPVVRIPEPEPEAD
jgi:hypothetical protein